MSNNPNHDIAEAVVNNQISELELATLESVTSKPNGLLHVVVDYHGDVDEVDLDENGDVVATAIGMYNGIVTDSPNLYDRAAVDLCLDYDIRLRFEFPTPWFQAYITDRIEIEELHSRVWDTLHVVDPEGTPRSLADFPEMVAAIEAEQGPPE